MRVLLPALLVSVMIPFTAVAAPVAQTSDKAHCERVIVKHPDSTEVTRETCTQYPDGTV